MSCRSVTAEELGVGPGWGAGQNMWYMQELNQFLAQMLLPSQEAAAVSSRRQLRSEKPEPALARAMRKVAADTANVRQHAHLRQSPAQQPLQDLLVATRAPEGQAQGEALQVERQTQRAALPVRRQLQAERGMLQEATDGTMQEALLADLAAAETMLPLADEVGEIYMYTADDIRAIAPLWWNYTRQMRVFHETHAKVWYQLQLPLQSFAVLWPILSCCTHTSNLVACSLHWLSTGRSHIAESTSSLEYRSSVITSQHQHHHRNKHHHTIASTLSPEPRSSRHESSLWWHHSINHAYFIYIIYIILCRSCPKTLPSSDHGLQRCMPLLWVLHKQASITEPMVAQSCTLPALRRPSIKRVRICPCCELP